MWFKCRCYFFFNFNAFFTWRVSGAITGLCDRIQRPTRQVTAPWWREYCLTVALFYIWNHNIFGTNQHNQNRIDVSDYQQFSISRLQWTTTLKERAVPVEILIQRNSRPNNCKVNISNNAVKNSHYRGDGDRRIQVNNAWGRNVNRPNNNHFYVQCPNLNKILLPYLKWRITYYLYRMYILNCMISLITIKN